MTVDERERRHLHEALVSTLGHDPADTLMAYLPPTGWADVATKHDLAAFGATLRAEFSANLHREIDTVRSEIRGEIGSLHDALRTQFYWTATLLAVQLSAFIALLKLG